MTRSKTHLWPDVVSFFQSRDASVPEFAAMGAAVAALAQSRYATGLHPVQSMHTLILYQHDRAGPEDERLVLEVEGGELVLRYQPGRWPERTAALRTSPPEWTKRGSDAVALLERALHHLRWFVEYDAPAV